jgi:ABC-type dipeptide/oligopeptide/nickel transport system permease subunit
MVYDAHISLQVVVIVVGLVVTVGSVLGMIAGYGNRLIDEGIMRSMDMLYAFPVILSVIAILAILGKGIGNAMIAIATDYLTTFARMPGMLTAMRFNFLDDRLRDTLDPRLKRYSSVSDHNPFHSYFAWER